MRRIAIMRIATAVAAGCSLLSGGATAGMHDAQSKGQDIAPSEAHANPVSEPPAKGVRRPVTLQRLVRHFDFEEARHAPHEMPLNFYRYAARAGASAQGFPPFGSMALTNEVAYSGEWSFGFDLDGGSLAARIPTAVIPVMPLADYVVLARVRTEGLSHARARISAWFHRADGEMIAPSRVSSRLVANDGAWDIVSIHVRGRYVDAADLVVELALLQPQHFEGAASSQPLLEDVRGRAWFDDLTIWHVPRVEMSLSQQTEPQDEPGAITAATLTMMVLDLAHDELESRLRVFDLDGRLVLDRAFPAPRAPVPQSIGMELERYGWYRAVLDVSHRGELTAQRTLNFLHSPRKPGRAAPKHGRDRFTSVLALPEDWRDHTEHLPEMARAAGADAVILPVLTRDLTLESAREIHDRSRSTIEHFRRDGVDLTFALSSIPEELALRLDVPGADVFFALGGEAAQWREYLDDLLSSFGFEVDQWQLGHTDASGSGAAMWRAQLPAIINHIRGELSRYVPQPIIGLPLLAEHAAMRRAGEDSRTIVIPHAARPQAIADIVAETLSGAPNADPSTSRIMLDLPRADLYAPRDRVTDLAMRVLHGWRAGVRDIAIALPWRFDDDNVPMADPTLGPWRALAAHLSGRRFAGELALGPGLHAWILEDVDHQDAALVVWRDRVGEGSTRRRLTNSPSTSFTMQLAERDVYAVDLFGNKQVIHSISGEHTVRPGETPMFIEGISAPLVKFRGGFALEPSLIPAEARAHEHHIVLRNPWDLPISGTIQLMDDQQWRLTPRMHSFEIPAGGIVRLPIQIVLDRSIIAGRKKLRAHVVLAADGNYALDVETDIEVGLDHIDLFGTWQVVRNAETGKDDLIITQFVSNEAADARNGSAGRAVTADAYLVAPGVRRQRRLITALAPGELAIRSFHIPGGAELLAGKTIRLGLASRNSPARLNFLMEIPDFLQAATAHVPEQ